MNNLTSFIIVDKSKIIDKISTDIIIPQYSCITNKNTETFKSSGSAITTELMGSIGSTHSTVSIQMFGSMESINSLKSAQMLSSRGSFSKTNEKMSSSSCYYQASSNNILNFGFPDGIKYINNLFKNKPDIEVLNKINKFDISSDYKLLFFKNINEISKISNKYKISDIELIAIIFIYFGNKNILFDNLNLDHINNKQEIFDFYIKQYNILI